MSINNLPSGSKKAAQVKHDTRNFRACLGGERALCPAGKAERAAKL